MQLIEKEIIALLKTGNFSIHYHGIGEGTIYEGKFKYEDIEKYPDAARFDFNHRGEGYLLDIVKWLVAALGGTSGTI